MKRLLPILFFCVAAFAQLPQPGPGGGGSSGPTHTTGSGAPVGACTSKNRYTDTTAEEVYECVDSAWKRSLTTDDGATGVVELTEGSAPSNAPSGTQRLYFDSSDHVLKAKNSSGTVALIGGYPRVVVTAEYTDRATSVTEFNLLASAPAGMYRLLYYAAVRALAGGTCTITSTHKYTYAGSEKTINATAMDLNISTVVTTSNYNNNGIFFMVDDGTNIKLSTSVSGAGCGGAQRYDAYYALERVR